MDGLEKHEGLESTGLSNHKYKYKARLAQVASWGYSHSLGGRKKNQLGKKGEFRFTLVAHDMLVDIHPGNVQLGRFEYESMRSGERDGWRHRFARCQHLDGK